MKVRQAVVMVGGMGTRLRPLTENRPKPMLPVADRPCIWYLMRSLARAGIEEVILACGYKPGMMEALGDGSDLGIKIFYSYEDEPLGTAGAIKNVEGRLDDVFVAANGDVFADIDVREEIDGTVKVLGDFILFNYKTEGEDLSLADQASAPMLLTLDATPDGEWVVVDAKVCKDSEQDNGFLSEMCEAMGMTEDDFNIALQLKDLGVVCAVSEFLNENPAISRIEYAGQMLDFNALSNEIARCLTELTGVTEETEGLA